MTSPATGLEAAIARRQDAVAHDLDSVLGGASLCAVSRGGDRVDGAKYLEGRLAVLTELRRRVRRTQGVGIDEVEQVAAVWRDQLEVARRRDQGPAWLAYRAGGADEAADLLDRFRTTGT